MKAGGRVQRAAACAVFPLLCALSTASCGGSPPAPITPLVSPTAALVSERLFCPDEYLKWSLGWNGIEGASTEMVTGQPGEIDGQPAIIVYSMSRSSDLAAIFREVREELTTQLSLKTGRPLRNASNTQEDKDREIVNVEYSESDTGFHYAIKLRGTVDPQDWTRSETQELGDVHAFLAKLRVWDGKPAAGAFTFVQSGRSHYRVEVVRRETETIKTPLGSFPAVRFHGHATLMRVNQQDQADPIVREFSVWRSEDGRFLPLRFEVTTRLGAVRGTLVQMKQSDTTDCIKVPAR